MSSSRPLLDAAGRRRSPATTPGWRAAIAPRSKGLTYPAGPPTVDEIVAVMRQAGNNRHVYALRVTPSAVALDPDGAIAVQVAEGATAIEALIRTALSSPSGVLGDADA